MKNAFFYFILFPFLGFINALRNYRSSWAKPTVIMFVSFFGLSMVKSDTVDSTRYVQNLEMMYNSNKDFETIQAGFYNSEGGGQADIYVTLTTFLFSLFTDNGNILFMFFGLVFGYFYANNIWLVLNQSKGKLHWEQHLLLAAFSMIIGFWTINGVRMWTAAHIFFYGGFLYLFQDRKKGLAIAASSILFHFSFVLPVFLLISYSLVKLNFRFLYLFYIASFFIAELNVDFIRTTLESNLPDFLLPKVKTYFNEDYLEGYEEVAVSVNWYVLYYKKILTYFTVIFISIIFFKANPTAQTKKLLGFSLLFLSVANILSLLPSGARFLNVAFLFSLATSFIIASNSKDIFISKSVRFLSPLLILFCIISVRLSLDYFNVTTLTNPLVVFLTNINQPLIDFIK
ncbi:hypothetical protein [Flavobacterium wongokense]|uniref:hypothetical protein n=1 Tax=Flavobacterium wongokense TaxID=2910674 RepID=UPI001F27BF59|nr:hypothetical protein [Flavobacterium sp. WG47]MCF6132704.1 hypothetical protein [Flavobacterium sp. WG47]